MFRPQCCGAGTFLSEPVWRSGSGSSIDKTEEILNDILFVRYRIDQRLIKKQMPKNKWIFPFLIGRREFVKTIVLMVESLPVFFIGAVAGEKRTGSVTLV